MQHSRKDDLATWHSNRLFSAASLGPQSTLDDRVFDGMLRLAYSGLVGMAWSAPPCKEFSRLKLKRPGPKALRTPEYMDGVPGLSSAEQARVDASAAIHCRSRAILRQVISSAGQAGMEQPPSAMSGLQDDYATMLREWAARCSHVAASSHGMDVYKSWAVCASFESIAQLASTCAHPPGSPHHRRQESRRQVSQRARSRIPFVPCAQPSTDFSPIRHIPEPTERQHCRLCRHATRDICPS